MSEEGFRIELYRLVPSVGSYTKLDEIRNYSDVTFYSPRNDAGLASFTIPGMSDKATVANLRRYSTIVAMKYNNTFVWTGFIDRVSPTYKGDDYNIKVECRQYFAHLYKRFISERYDGIDAGEIAWEMINYTQSLDDGDLGITEGSIEVTQDRDREYQSKKIGEAIVDLTNVINGFDFTLQPIVDANNNLTSHTFNVFADLGQYRANVPALNLGGNVLGFSAFTKDEIINEVEIKGAGTGQENIVATASDATSRGNFSRIEDIKLRDDISIQTTLQEHADRFIDENANETMFIDIDIRPESQLALGSFDIGDTININLAVPEMSYTFVGQAEVMAIECAVNDLNVLSYSTRVKYTIL